jgi:DNA-binding NarL/FixJ family response regulator
MPDLHVVGETDGERDLWPIVDASAPDVVIAEIDLREGSAFTIARELRRRGLHTKLMVLAHAQAHETVARAFACGALGFARKDDTFVEVIAGLRQVLRGERHLSSRVSPSLLEQHDVGAFDSLSPRELEIFDLVVRGRSTKEIAGELHIAIKTVETHRTKINRKLRTHSPADLVRVAVRHGRALAG